MRNLFIVDGASGVGKSDLIRYVKDFYEDNTLIQKYSTRPKRSYEVQQNWKLDLQFISDDEFDDLKLDYQYVYAGHRYGFRREDLRAALQSKSNVFIIVRNANVIQQLKDEFSFINVVAVYIYTDQDKCQERLHGLKMSEEEISASLGRLAIAFADYAAHSHLYDEIIINNASRDEYHRLISTMLEKYRRHPEVDENLVFLLRSNSKEVLDAAEAIKRAVKAAAEEAGHRFRCLDLTDLKKGGFQISDEAKNHIRRCRLAIVDLTENRPNVYYELGFADGIGKDCILTARKGTEPHFYPKQRKIIFYETASELEGEVREELEGFLACD